MNQEKIGKFIAKCRKEKNMTQQELSEKLGVSDRTVGNWENGRNMPDLSLFKPLCIELGITLNDLMSGEKVQEKEYQEKLEENIINTIDYTNKKVTSKNNFIRMIFLLFGFLLILSAMSIFPSESSWGSIYSVLGIILVMMGFSKFTKKYTYWKRLVCNGIFFLVLVFILLFIDYIGVVVIHQAPRFAYRKTTIYNMIIYETPFYNAYRINFDTENEYYVVDYKKEYTKDTVPNIPFNRDKTSIDFLIRYKSKYLGDNSNTGNMISSLPLSEYGYTFQIDPEKLSLTINYHMTGWYINEDNYLEKSLVYNSVSLFVLIDNLEAVHYNFTGNAYEITRKCVEENYPNFKEIKKNEIDKKNFNQYLESKMNDNQFIDSIFTKFFSK